jgi:hypothetical protein
MLPLDLSDNQTIIAIGLSVVALVFILRRLVLRTGPRNRRLPVSQTPAEIEAAENSATALVEQLEVRLYDFAREVEGRMTTKIAVLDRLIINADREIIRLEQVLAESRRLGTPSASARQPDAIVSPTLDDKDQRHAA